MKISFLIFTAVIFLMGIISCKENSSKKVTENKATSICSDKCEAKNKSSKLSCKLTTPELQKRKETVLESLRKQVIESKELPKGYAFKFVGTDQMIDEILEFIKTERECCDFFTFNLSVGGDKSEIWLEIIGIDGAKDFVKTELEL
jgi:hypothetical protein